MTRRTDRQRALDFVVGAKPVVCRSKFSNSEEVTANGAAPPRINTVISLSNTTACPASAFYDEQRENSDASNSPGLASIASGAIVMAVFAQSLSSSSHGRTED
jgi:hypothetical protein